MLKSSVVVSAIASRPAGGFGLRDSEFGNGSAAEKRMGADELLSPAGRFSLIDSDFGNLQGITLVEMTF